MHSRTWYLIGLSGLIAVLTLASGLARAEQAGSTVLVFPLRGPGGLIVRNEIHKAIVPSIPTAKKIGGGLAKAPIRTAARFKSEANIGGRVRCPGKTCTVEVLIFKRNGKTWVKARRTSSRGAIAKTAAAIAVELLGKIGLASGSSRGSGGQIQDDEKARGPSDSDDLFASRTAPPPNLSDDVGPPSVEEERSSDDDEDEEEEDEEEDDDGEDSGRDHEFDALEVYFNTDLNIARNNCVDLERADVNLDGCDRDNPYYDDRAYASGPFASLGTRLIVFPGAFVDRSRWFSHFGLYFEYGHSVGLATKRQFEHADPPPDGESPYFDVHLDTVQQNIRAGLVYRFPIPFTSTRGPQLRLMVGFGYYEFSFNDNDYPDDNDISSLYRDSNPYMPSSRYLSVDSGLELRIPVRGFIFPYMVFMYRATLDGGQIDRIYGPDTTIHGIAGELGLRIEVGAGVRLIAGAELLWYGTTFDGDFAPVDGAEETLWRDVAYPGDTASDLIIRIRMGVGWAY